MKSVERNVGHSLWRQGWVSRSHIGRMQLPWRPTNPVALGLITSLVLLGVALDTHCIE